MRRMKAMGVDGVFSDYPDVLYGEAGGLKPEPVAMPVLQPSFGM